jgi:hypothetical protein
MESIESAFEKLSIDKDLSKARTKPTVISTWSEENSDLLEKSFSGVKTVAIDAEGYNLSRDGSITLLTVALEGGICFVFDVMGKVKDDPLIIWLRTLLEDLSVVKVIHDCKMDADALLFHLSIQLKHVHDSSVWHEVIFGEAERNLNDVLRANALPINSARHKDLYEANPRFWESR